MDDHLIDKILLEHRGDERLSAVLDRLGIVAPVNENWPAELHKSGLFELTAKPDYLKKTEFGKQVKSKGGLVGYHNSLMNEEQEKRKERQLDTELKELSVKHLRLSIWQIKGWWWLLILSFVAASIASNLELILEWLGVKG